MHLKYSLGFPAASVIRLVGWLLFIPRFFCATITCPPPDFPESGRYLPVKADYEVGQIIIYHCDNWIPTHWVAKCESSGKWSREAPFCDTPIKLKTTTASSKALETAVLDANPNTCSPTRNDTEEFLRFSLDHEAVVFATVICWRQSSKKIQIVGSVWQVTYYGNSSACMLGTYTYRKTDVKTENITVQISSDTNSSILLCMFQVFAKDDKWCDHPPLTPFPNGQLEVGRSKAVLHCNKGFKEIEGREVYATCENNKWSYQSLHCGDGKPETDNKILDGKSETDYKMLDGKSETDYKILAIVFGCVVVLGILILVGLKMFFILRKRTRGVVVKHKPGEDICFLSPLYDSGHSAIDSSEPECIDACDVNQSKASE